MAKGRKRGCPVNIKNWLVYILDKATDTFVRIYGLSSLSRGIDSETEDGSADTDVWAEPYVTKRSGSSSLEGKPVVEEATGANDAGQELLTSYAEVAGCEGDATLKFVDPYGHAWLGDYIVTSHELSADESGTTASWDLEQVGEVEVLPYIHVEGVALKDGEADASALSMKVGDASKIITVAFTPEDASNKRFRVSNNKRSVVTVGGVNENGFTITPVSAGTATISITTINGGKTATLTVTVSA